MEKKIVLPKGKSIKFLDYTIANSPNNDGLVLMKKGNKAKGYECHLGNYGEGTQENIDVCKKYAILHFMVARPDVFASTIVNKARRVNSGTMHEYFLLKKCLEKEKIEMPKEITAGDESNFMIYFKNEPLSAEKEISNQVEVEKETCHYFYYLGAADGILKSLSREVEKKPDFEKRYKEFESSK